MAATAEGPPVVKEVEEASCAAEARASTSSTSEVGSTKSTAATTAAGGVECADWSISTDAGRTKALAASFPDSASDSSGSRSLRRGPEVINWSAVRLGHRIEPCAGYAHCADDIYLLASFLELAELPDIDSAAVKLMLRTIKFLNLCDYSVEDVCSILAHASAYFLDAWNLCGEAMDSSEVGHVLATLTFIAHCYVQDETCPLNIWHQHLFRKYCPLKTLNAAVVRLLQIRRFVLRLEEKDLSHRFATLLQAAHTTRQQRLSQLSSSSEAVAAIGTSRPTAAASADPLNLQPAPEQGSTAA